MHLKATLFHILQSVCLTAVYLTTMLSSLAYAESSQQYLIPQSMQVSDQLTSPAAGVTDIKFNELYKTPVGPKGFDLTKKTIALIGKRIRIVGYMAKSEPATPGLFVLSPSPVEMGDEDEKLVDDFPPNVMFVHMGDAQLAVPYIDRLIKLTGTLQVGSFDEVDGHVSTFRLELDPEIVKDLTRALSSTHASK
ncbi:MAG: hypothetical protein H7Z18_04700 [Methylophilaceae bacterium]|nr:hypothetical protein [Methylophilaceae bacterium]